MTTVTTMRSEDARKGFRDILDSTIAGVDTIIERYGKPTAVVVNYDKWQMMQKRYVAMLEEQSRLIDDGEFVAWDDVKKEMQAQGQID